MKRDPKFSGDPAKIAERVTELEGRMMRANGQLALLLSKPETDWFLLFVWFLAGLYISRLIYQSETEGRRR